MTTVTRLTTGSEFEKKASYSRLVMLDNWIFVSNTAGRHPVTRQIPEDLRQQTLHNWYLLPYFIETSHLG